jgi:hypothetical protein
MKISITLTQTETEQIKTLLDYSTYENIESYLYDCLNDFSKYTTFHESNNLLTIQDKTKEK